MSVNWKAFANQISHYQSFVLVSHIRPDCDALGSELGMAYVLRQIGKDVRIINAHRTPPALHLMLSPRHVDFTDDYLADLEAALADVRAGAVKPAGEVRYS